MLVKLMREGGVERTRRWVAALLLAPEPERDAIVDAVARRLAAIYADVPSDADPSDGSGHVLRVAGDPVQRDGFIEQVIRSYPPTEVGPADNGADPPAASRGPA